MTTNKIYLLQFYNYKNHDVYTIGAYSSVENILQIDTAKEFKLSDGEYRIVGFILDSTRAKTLKTKMVSCKGAEADWQDKVVD